MSTANALWVAGQRLDLFEDTSLLPTFQANDRTRPESLQSDYSPEFEVPGSAHNHRLLKHAAASQPAQGQAYARLPCILTSGGAELLPLGILLVKGFKEGKYQLQLLGGNRRLVDALLKPDGSDKMLSDLDLSVYNHSYTAANVLAGLPYSFYQKNGWGYEIFDRGKPVTPDAVDPFTLYPSVSYLLVLQAIVEAAGFTCDDLSTEPLFAALSVPSANPYTFPEKFREARRLQAGYSYDYPPTAQIRQVGLIHRAGFGWEQLVFGYTSQKPYHQPDYTTGADYGFGSYTVGQLGYYDLSGSVAVNFGSDQGPGDVRCKVGLRINGQAVFDMNGNELGKDEKEGKELAGQYADNTFAPKLSKMLLKPGDVVSLWWKGDEIPSGLGFGPGSPIWQIGPVGPQVQLTGNRRVAASSTLTVELLPDFPPGGEVRLADWLPDLKQSEFFQTAMVLGNLTVEADQYTNHLRISPGCTLLENVPQAVNWTRKRDIAAPLGRIPERTLSYRLGNYAQANRLNWKVDERVTPGYGNGLLRVADAVLQPTADLFTLPFAATEDSKQVVGLLEILNFEAQGLTATPLVYSAVKAEPRLALRGPERGISGQLITVPAYVDKDGNPHAAQLAPFTTTASYFTSPDLSLLLDDTVLTHFWQDTRATLDQARVVQEKYRLTAQDIAGLRFNRPVWDGGLGDYFLISKISEFDARRSTEVELVRLNSKYLPPPTAPGAGLAEWYSGEWFHAEFY